jgi:hypothetical protein
MRLHRLAAPIAAVVLATGCKELVWQARLLPPDSPELVAADPAAPYLKAHGRDGAVTVLSRWRADATARTLSGEGRRFDADRRLIATGPVTLPFDEVALVETNRPELLERSELAILGVAAGTTAVVAALCAASPKTCFGSCPTFYAGADGAGPVLAEGFSAAVARPLEQTDVDALDLPGPRGPLVQLTMRNEALETHFVRSVRLLAAARPPGGRVYRAGDRYLPAGRELAPTACRGAAGDCLAAVAADDALEYRSPAGERDLAEQEEIELTFPRPAGLAGLVVRGRNSLLNTFVFYQGLAWLGSRAGDAFARLEALPPGELPALDEWARLLGRAEVEVLGAAGWAPAGGFGEVGPIARETQLVVLPEALPPGEVRVRLRLTRGNWKLDRLALVELSGPPVAPLIIPPAAVRRGGAPEPAALARLRGEGARLVSLPGDAWTLDFPLPPELAGAELFLESRGYYLEWLRQEWLRDEDPRAAVALLAHPRDALRRLAPAYKRIEQEAERAFWSSRMGATP